MSDNHHDMHDHAAHGHAAQDSHHHGANLLGPASDDLAECPVMPGSMIAKTDAEAAGLFRDYEGTRYYLCCSSCGPLFDADPAKYAAAA